MIMIRTKIPAKTSHRWTKRMLHVLVRVKSPKQKEIYKRLLRGKHVENPGLFLQAVLEGDYSTAMARANSEQFYLLETLPHLRVKTEKGYYKYVINIKL